MCHRNSDIALALHALYGSNFDAILGSDLDANQQSNCMFMTLGAACIRDAEIYMDEVVDSFDFGKYQKMFDMTGYGVSFENILSPDWLPPEKLWEQP